MSILALSIFPCYVNLPYVNSLLCFVNPLLLCQSSLARSIFPCFVNLPLLCKSSLTMSILSYFVNLRLLHQSQNSLLFSSVSQSIKSCFNLQYKECHCPFLCFPPPICFFVTLLCDYHFFLPFILMVALIREMVNGLCNLFYRLHRSSAVQHRRCNDDVRCSALRAVMYDPCPFSPWTNKNIFFLNSRYSRMGRIKNKEFYLPEFSLLCFFN